VDGLALPSAWSVAIARICGAACALFAAMTVGSIEQFSYEPPGWNLNHLPDPWNYRCTDNYPGSFTCIWRGAYTPQPGGPDCNVRPCGIGQLDPHDQGRQGVATPPSGPGYLPGGIDPHGSSPMPAQTGVPFPPTGGQLAGVGSGLGQLDAPRAYFRTPPPPIPARPAVLRPPVLAQPPPTDSKSKPREENRPPPTESRSKREENKEPKRENGRPIDVQRQPGSR
jgi:hypothetical protein